MTYRVELGGRALKQMHGLPDRAFDSLIEAMAACRSRASPELEAL